ncbi:MAG: hypothetical protein A2Z83_00980 [Omnitrophica bacterium GWA2_52_8]|nr:MAG: hypothetical protein A2Z83_00980 [Omnitrophica bacterium GWA2_52_8]
MDGKSYLDFCLNKVVEQRGQDLFLKVGAVPRIRVGGQVSMIKTEPARNEQLETILEMLLNPYQALAYQQHKSVDFAFTAESNGRRFRGNAFFQQGQHSIVIRALWRDIPSMEELHIPAILKQMALERSGIILIGGTVSSGKTSTVHAIIEMMNRTSRRHIVTVEDPVEYLHSDKNCLINQREIGQDTNDFMSALKYVVRQSPDVVVIGEMRDAETFNFALNAAEIGRLVMATVHARSVVQMFDRILGFFPIDKREQVLSQLYPNITCFALQKLVVGKDGKTLYPAFEILIGNYTTRQLVREKKFDKLYQAMKNATAEGMRTLEQSLFDLWQQGSIDETEALRNTDHAQELRNIMHGIEIDGEKGKILGT